MIPAAKANVRVSELIHYFVKRVPNAGRTQLVKFLYLTDLFSRQFLGKPLTDLDYIWHDHGPFDSKILATISDLVDSKTIKEKKVQYPRGKGFQYIAVTAPRPLTIDEDTAEIVKFVVKQYGTVSLDTLLRRVYKTRPMLDAKERNGRGKKLRMNIVDNTRRELFRGIKKGEKQLEQGRTVSLFEIFPKARSMT